ncbi:YbgC/FadM family acyl-CoA thioesterase [Campylobacter corcagiensis]|uniref:YbgC/FadM family acyl-CoA thioesterase n=1 Tax=Campylobacter corcagiensis TaxID=1448857 RepID=A0A7M1LDY5_9BACT|nr:YbgC/FadM family acyl-CoA thioesterase [Campylobacter corcagiensis]QKF65097.1 acyl-CoA thioesterase [Campylobacter corcagiensis]QOQ86758.1 YbgC/FadM family acyl-CoA thioesterase [Campylobacter corcagiensis]
MKIRVYYEDTDAAGIVYHANYIKYCERARSELFFSNGVVKFSPNSHFVVTKIEANFLATASLGDVLEIKGRVLELKKASAVMLQEIFKDDKKIFEAKIKVAFVVDKKPTKMSDKVLEFMEKFKEF